MQKARKWVTEGDESLDELAGETLLKMVPQPPKGGASIHDTLTLQEPARPTSGTSAKATIEVFDKSLPPVPSRGRASSRNNSARPALKAKTTNSKVHKKCDSQSSRLKISPPTLESTTSSTVNADSRPATRSSGKTLPVLHSAATDPVGLNRKISHLMEQAATQEAESQRRAAILTELSTKPSPLQRGRKAFVKATRAFKDRLSSNNTNERVRAQVLTPVSPLSSADGTHQPSDSSFDGTNRKGRLDRRMAEGANLSNPKIRSLMGDGNVPRKPLPVYESMRSRVQESSSLEDPFSDSHEAKRNLRPSDYSGFDFDFDKRKHKSEIEKIEAPLTTNGKRDESTSQHKQQLAEGLQKPRFSDMISGLAQHSDTTFFSSSPVAHSTPCDRLATRPAPASNKRLSMLTRSPSILEFSFEDQSGDEHSVTPSTVSKTITDGSQSIKRKSGQENLRSPTVPVTKRARVSSRLSRDDTANLAIGLSNLETEDERTPLSQRDKNARKPPTPRKLNKGKGLGIFEVGKGKEKESGPEEPPPKELRPKGLIGKRSSFPRPRSMMFGRDSRAGNRNFAKLDDDMDVDELA